MLEELKRLVVKQHLSMGNLSERDHTLVLALAAHALPLAQSMSEREVNDHLKTWLAGDGQMLAVDHVELRRTLVDLGFVSRDDFGQSYQRTRPSAQHFAFECCTWLGTLELSESIAQHRREAAVLRMARKQAHLNA